MPEHSETIEYAVDGGRYAGFLALPEGEGSRPGVIVIQEPWGLDVHVRELTRRFARAGLIALAPDLYNGRGAGEEPTVLPDQPAPDEARKLAMELEHERAVNAMVGAVNYLSGLDVVHVGAVGFGMGGSLALALAANTPRLDGVVSFYGGWPLSVRQAEQIGCPALLFFGGRDSEIPPERIAELRAALDGAAVPNEVVVYPGAGHAFFNDTRPEAYDAAAAYDAWRRTIGFFEKELEAELGA